MSKFLRLSSSVINTSYIRYIQIKQNTFHIEMFNNRIHGTMILGSGNMDVEDESFEVCAEEPPTDYKLVEEWIKNLDKETSSLK